MYLPQCPHCPLAKHELALFPFKISPAVDCSRLLQDFRLHCFSSIITSSLKHWKQNPSPPFPPSLLNAHSFFCSLSLQNWITYVLLLHLETSPPSLTHFSEAFIPPTHTHTPLKWQGSKTHFAKSMALYYISTWHRWSCFWNNFLSSKTTMCPGFLCHWPFLAALLLSLWWHLNVKMPLISPPPHLIS